MDVVRELIIQEFSNGEVRVNGSIKDKIGAYGLLELAKDAIRDYGKQEKLIQVPTYVVPKNGQ